MSSVFNQATMFLPDAQGLLNGFLAKRTKHLEDMARNLRQELIIGKRACQIEVSSRREALAFLHVLSALNDVALDIKNVMIISMGLKEAGDITQYLKDKMPGLVSPAIFWAHIASQSGNKVKINTPQIEPDLTVLLKPTHIQAQAARAFVTAWHAPILGVHVNWRRGPAPGAGHPFHPINQGGPIATHPAPSPVQVLHPTSQWLG